MSKLKCRITDMHKINPAVASNKSWDVEGMYVPNTDNGIIPSIRHQIKRLQSQVYRDRHLLERYPAQLQKAKDHIDTLKVCLKELREKEQTRKPYYIPEPFGLPFELTKKDTFRKLNKD